MNNQETQRQRNITQEIHLLDEETDRLIDVVNSLTELLQPYLVTSPHKDEENENEMKYEKCERAIDIQNERLMVSDQVKRLENIIKNFDD